jgi:hypothetical protein
MRTLGALGTFIGTFRAAHATIHVITCRNGASHILPVTVNATVDDTTHWIRVSGNHVVGPVLETDIPAGADTCNGLIDVNNQTFDYVVAFPGDHHFVYPPSSPHSEDGFIVLSEASTVLPAVMRLDQQMLYPNPFEDQLMLHTMDATAVNIIYAHGAQVASYQLAAGGSTLHMELGTVPKGIHVCEVLHDADVIATQRMLQQ